MTEASPYSAAASALGFMYQPRLALLRILALPETTNLLIEKSDDLDFDDSSGSKSLLSLKHRALGTRLTDLDADFWKSVRVWLNHYENDGKAGSAAEFALFTTATISPDSYLKGFTDDELDGPGRSEAAMEALAASTGKVLGAIRASLETLTEAERGDFFRRIVIFDDAPRIEAIPQLVMDQHLRTVRRDARGAVFERLEGWWSGVMIALLTGARTQAVTGYEVSDRMMAIADEYRGDSLPITFGSQHPDGAIDAANDSRLFVVQLRDIDVSPTRLQKAIIDYYRAFEQRSAWAREDLLIAGEIEEYEARLVDEWERYREIVFESLGDGDSDDHFKKAGRALYNWAETETSHLRIRERVTEPYVVRGGFHILANVSPAPQIYWNPRFMTRLAALLEVAA